MQKLSNDFLNEFIKCCLVSETIFSVSRKHMEYHFLPTNSYKKIWKKINDTYELSNKLSTLGTLFENFKNDEDCVDILKKVKKCNVSASKEIIFSQFEVYIKNVRFVELYKEIGSLYNEGKEEEAIKIQAKKSEEIVNFSLKKETYSKVFRGYEERSKQRELKVDESNVKIPFGIHALDFFTYGGGRAGTSALVMARSGGGKSTAMRWFGLNAARLGYRVVHFQVEGTEEETMDLYDSAWTGVDLEDLEWGGVTQLREKQIKDTNKELINKGGEIYVVASEQFDSMSVEFCDSFLEEFSKNIGAPHLILFDYLEELEVEGKYGGESGERRRRRKIAKKITNIAIKYKSFCVTGTQATDIKKEKWNNPEYVMTRSDISEFKGALQPFSYFMTFNQTEDEYTNGVIRLYNDKFRRHKAGQVYPIFQSLKNGRFYDSKRTLQQLWDEKKNQPKFILI